MLTIRAADWEHDADALAALDTSFTTESIYRAAFDDLTFRFVEKPITPPLTKRYEFRPVDEDERREWDCALVAEEDGSLAGFAAAQYVAWNRRVVLWHLYVAPGFRRRGVASRLLEAVGAFALSRNARCLWVETQNVNYPAIRFYRRSGFRLCGFDDTLYDPENLTMKEIALFLARPVQGTGA